MPFWGPVLASVGSSVVSGIFGRKSAKEQRANQGIDYQKLVRDAEAAGFNPLTALQNGGGAAYDRSTLPPISSGAFIAEAIKRGADTYYNQVSAQEDREAEAARQAHEVRLKQMELQNRPGRMAFGYDLKAVPPIEPPKKHVMPALAVGDQREKAPLAARIADTAKVVAPANKRPPLHPFSPERQKDKYIPVMDAFGVETTLHKDIADKLDIKPWGKMSAGDHTEVYGELVGEGGIAVNADKVVKSATGQTIGEQTLRKSREQRKEEHEKRKERESNPNRFERWDPFVPW